MTMDAFLIHDIQLAGAALAGWLLGSLIKAVVGALAEARRREGQRHG